MTSFDKPTILNILFFIKQYKIKLYLIIKDDNACCYIKYVLMIEAGHYYILKETHINLFFVQGGEGRILSLKACRK